MKPIAALILFLLALLLAACTADPSEPQTRLTVADALASADAAGFARAEQPHPFVFPQDHGPHPDYAIEWWYYTGNLQTATGRHFGYQFTIFRFGLQPGEPQRESDWATNAIYMAHLALTDTDAGQFYAFERISRGAAGLAGAEGQPFRAWVEDWQVDGSGPQGMQMRIQAAQAPIALDLTLDGTMRPPVLQGNAGLSQKSATPGNASYYYSLTRMPTTGTLTLNGESFAVQGLSWMDREWSTSILEPGVVGWDWFALQFDDGRDLMVARLRNEDGSDAYAFASLVQADGAYRMLRPEEFRLRVTDTWQSSHTGARYPAGWRLEIPSERLDVQVSPVIADQELRLTIAYWEGAVQVAGSATGRGYVELTGYTDQGDQSMRAR